MQPHQQQLSREPTKKSCLQEACWPNKALSQMAHRLCPAKGPKTLFQPSKSSHNRVLLTRPEVLLYLSFIPCLSVTLTKIVAQNH